MKSDVEKLSPTRVKLSIEVPFVDLKPHIDGAYKSLSEKITIPGFRKGKVPSAMIDQRVGRGAVLDEAINAAIPTFYSQAEDVKVLGHMVGNIDSKNIYIGNKGVIRGNLHFENNLTVLEGADISGHVQKNKKDKVKRSDTDKVKYLEHNKIAS